MSNLPITSRIKRSPLQNQAANAIDPDDPKPLTAKGIIKGEPITSTETITTKRKPTGVSYEDAYKKADKTKYPTFESFKDAAIAYNKENDTVTETKTTVKPGKDSSWEENLKVKTTGDVFQPWETRQMSRSIKKEQRDIRRSKIKAGKFGSQNKNGEWVAKEGVNPRQQAKFDEAKAELTEFQAMATRNKAARASGKKGGTIGVATGERNATLSDVGDINAQTIYLNRQNGTENSSEQNNTTTSNTTEQNNTTTSNTTEENNTGTDNTTEDKSDSGVKMKPSAFKMYGKSPAVKTLQGAQNTLPQHLQDAIKAAPESPAKLGPLAAIAGKALIGAAVNKLASSNKMRSGFKMKGYGKK